MSEIRLKIKDAYMNAFWAYIQSLPQGTIQIVVPKVRKQAVNKVEVQNTAILNADTQIRKGVTLAQLAEEQSYTKTNWQKVNQIAKDMAIEEPIEDLLAQLTP